MDPVYPVYADSNVVAGRSGKADESGRYAGIVYLPCTAENAFQPALPDRRSISSTSATPTIPPARWRPARPSSAGSTTRGRTRRSSCTTPPTRRTSATRTCPARSTRSPGRGRWPSSAAASPRTRASPGCGSPTPSCPRRHRAGWPTARREPQRALAAARGHQVQRPALHHPAGRRGHLHPDGQPGAGPHRRLHGNARIIAQGLAPRSPSTGAPRALHLDRTGRARRGSSSTAAGRRPRPRRAGSGFGPAGEGDAASPPSVPRADRESGRAHQDPTLRAAPRCASRSDHPNQSACRGSCSGRARTASSISAMPTGPYSGRWISSRAIRSYQQRRRRFGRQGARRRPPACLTPAAGVDGSLEGARRHRAPTLADAAGPWVMAQVWHDLLFAHWPIDPRRCARGCRRASSSTRSTAGRGSASCRSA